MIPLQITAYLSSAIAVTDDYSPSLDALVEWLILDREGLTSAHVTEDKLLTPDLPLRKDKLGDEWYWAVSSPFYQYTEESTRYRKRWDYQDRHLDWGKKRAKVDTSQGNTKSYDLPLYLRITPRIDWFAIGDRMELEKLLPRCAGLGKKRSYGYGQITRWEVKEIGEDYTLFKNGKLTRPIPFREAIAQFKTEFQGHPVGTWGYRPPARLSCNQSLCLMPMGNVIKVG